jgi:hypothetical protein
MSGGGGSPLQAGKNSSMPAYGSQTTSPSANQYNPTYAPMQQNPEQAVQNMGLEALYQSMASQYAPISQQQNPMDQFYQQPAQRQMPAYENLSLNYRPNMSGIPANLNRVAPPVTREQMNPTPPAEPAAAVQGE